jgi:hypothetical protein
MQFEGMLRCMNISRGTHAFTFILTIYYNCNEYNPVSYHYSIFLLYLVPLEVVITMDRLLLRTSIDGKAKNLLKFSSIVNHTYVERTIILSSVIDSVDEDSFVR